MVSNVATAIEIGISVLRPSARLDAAPAVTNRISSVAYAVDEIASDEKTASAIVLLIRGCSCSADDSGGPTKMRLTASSVSVIRGGTGPRSQPFLYGTTDGL